MTNLIPSPLDEESKKAVKDVVINFKKMKMKDYAFFESNNVEPKISELIPILGRITNYTESELLELDLDEFLQIQESFSSAVANIVKKTTVGS
jgi:hypothetical protein